MKIKHTDNENFKISKEVYHFIDVLQVFLAKNELLDLALSYEMKDKTIFMTANFFD